MRLFPRSSTAALVVEVETGASLARLRHVLLMECYVCFTLYPVLGEAVTLARSYYSLYLYNVLVELRGIVLGHHVDRVITTTAASSFFLSKILQEVHFQLIVPSIAPKHHMGDNLSGVTIVCYY